MARSAAASLAIIIGWTPLEAFPASDPVLDCHLHRSKEVGFRERDSKDILEISIGIGPCYAATLMIVIRTELGEVLYSYVERWKQHTAVDWQDSHLPDVARKFVEQEVSDSMRTTASLPPYAEAEEFCDSYYETIEVSREDYERFRAEDRPLLCHSTHYEAWRCVLYDRRPGTSEIVVVGGL